MVDTDYESLPPKSAKPRHQYVRKKAPVVLPSSSVHGSSSPGKAVAMVGDLGEVGLEGRKRARTGEDDAGEGTRLKSKVRSSL